MLEGRRRPEKSRRDTAHRDAGRSKKSWKGYKGSKKTLKNRPQGGGWVLSRSESWSQMRGRINPTGEEIGELKGEL